MFSPNTGTTVNGKLVGRNLNVGSFEYCAGFVRDESQQIDFDGKYCLVSLQGKDAEEMKRSEGYQAFRLEISERSQRMLEFNMGDALGVCMPSSCELSEVVDVFNALVKPYGFSVLEPHRCTTISEPEPITSLQIVSL